MKDYLQQLVAKTDTLGDRESKDLTARGYLNLGRLLDDAALESVRSRLQILTDIEGADAGAELLDSEHIRHPSEPGVIRLADLVNKGPEFDLLYTHPRLLAGVARVLGGDFKLSSLNYRAALPGFGGQALHVDWPRAVSARHYQVCNAIWLLDDFSAENGPTRVVPGSHRWNELPADAMDDPRSSRTDEEKIIAPAGSVVLFNAHVWHGGTINRTNRPRRAVHSYFCKRQQPQQVDQRRYIRPATLSRLPPAVQYLLDVQPGGNAA